MKGHLSLLILCFIVCNVNSLLNTTATAKFKSNDLENPIKVVIDDSGSKFITWNNMSKYQIYDKSGKRRCAGSLTYPIAKVIWPSNYNLLMLTFPGKIIYRIQDQYCTSIKQFNFTDQIHDMSFVWRGQLPILLVSNWKGTFQQFNLNTFSNIKTFLSTAFIVDKVISTIYLNDGSSFYGLQIYNNTLRLEIFDTSLGMGYGALQLGYTLTGLTIMKNGKDVMCLATSLNGTQTNVIRFTTNLAVNTVVERQRLSLTLGMRQDNYMVLIKSISTEIQLINTKDGQTKQNVQYFQNSTFIQDCDYKNKTIVLLDDQGYFVTAQYYPTPQPDPIPPPKPQGLPLWEIVAFGVGGILLLTFLLLFIFRKRLPLKLKKILPKWFTGQNGSQSLLSSQQKIQAYINPQINRQNKKRQKNQEVQYIRPQMVRSFHANQNHQQHQDTQTEKSQSIIEPPNHVLQSRIVNNREPLPRQDIHEQSNIESIEDQQPDDVKMARLARLNSLNEADNNNGLFRHHRHQFQQQEIRQHEQKPEIFNRLSQRNSVQRGQLGQDSNETNFFIVKR